MANEEGEFRRDFAITSRKLPAFLVAPKRTSGLILFAHGSGSSRHSPRNRMIAERLNRAGFATLLFDLLTEGEGEDRRKVFYIPLLAERLQDATSWTRGDDECRALPIGYFGASTGAAAAITAASGRRDVKAIVSRGGRPDLAPGAALRGLKAPTLLIVGSRDVEVLRLNEQAMAQMHCPARLEIVAGASHLFEEAGTLESVGDLAAEWFGAHVRARA